MEFSVEEGQGEPNPGTLNTFEQSPDVSINCDVSDSENENISDNETCCGDGDARILEPEFSLRGPIASTPPFMQMQFPKTHFYFPAAMETFDSPLNLNRRPLLGADFVSQISRDSELLESTISQITQDLERFATPSPSPRHCQSPSPSTSRFQSSSVANSLGPTSNKKTPNSSRSDSTPVTSACTSISMFIHSSMESPLRKEKQQKLRSRFTTTQQMQEDLYESLGEKPSNLADENQLLYQTLDYERKKLILRKGLCSFIYGALKRQGEKVELLESRNRVKNEECAARLIFHTLLLHSYRKVQHQVNILVTDNTELQKSVENLCLQLRVVRHLQTAEKERAIEKIHEIGSLKNELAYAKKMLKKTKADLEKTERNCESVQQSNVELSEEKSKLQHDLHILEDKKQMLESSWEMEKKRTEKQIHETRTLKRQASELRHQIEDLSSQLDDWQERFRDLESKNWELHILLESRGKEFMELGKHRDALKRQVEELQELSLAFQTRKETLELQFEREENETRRVKKALNEAQTALVKQTARIGSLKTEIGKIQRESLSMHRELASHKLKNLRRRRAWVNIAMIVADPIGTIFRFFLNGGSRPDEFIR